MSSIGKSGKAYVTHEQIEQRAYEIYLQRGGADGTAEGDWLVAERELVGEQDRPDIPEGPSVPLASRRGVEASASAETEEAAKNIKPRSRGAAAGDRSSS